MNVTFLCMYEKLNSASNLVFNIAFLEQFVESFILFLTEVSLWCPVCLLREHVHK